MTVTDEAMEFLNQSGGGNSYPAVTFHNIGDTVKGVIVGVPRVVSTPNMQTGAPEKKLVIELRTDDGEMVSLWVKAGLMASAVRDAVTKAGADKLHDGGTLVVKYARDGEQKKPGFNAPKVYEAGYKAPAAGVNVDDLLAS